MLLQEAFSRSQAKFYLYLPSLFKISFYTSESVSLKLICDLWGGWGHERFILAFLEFSTVFGSGAQ